MKARTKHLGNASCTTKQTSSKATPERLLQQSIDKATKDKTENEGMAADGGAKEPIERSGEVNFVVKAQEDLRRIDLPINLYSSFW